MINWRIHKVSVTDSTNDDAKRAATLGEKEGYVVWGLHQSTGRGRQGRVWESPVGNLYCSILLRPETALSDIGQYSFVTALAVRDTVQAFLPTASINLKWPNDILVDGKKISGILLESTEQGLAIGIGLNVAHHPNNVLYPTTSLIASGAAMVELSVVLDALLKALQHWTQILRQQGFAPIRQAWLDHALRGAMTVRLAHVTLQGTFADLDINGHLRLHLADGSERVISSGDVFLPPGN